MPTSSIIPHSLLYFYYSTKPSGECDVVTGNGLGGAGDSGYNRKKARRPGAEKEKRMSKLSVGKVQVYTGNGKGKTTASLGLVLRAAGAGMRCYFGQFMKKGSTSEVRALREFLAHAVTVEQYGSGAELSGPDRERDTACARAGYEKARAALVSGEYDLVVLDDVSSALDYATDLRLRRALKENYSDTSVILISQRIASVRGADQILVLHNGRLMGLGTHDELVKSCDTYRAICRTQNVEVPGEEAMAV